MARHRRPAPKAARIRGPFAVTELGALEQAFIAGSLLWLLIGPRTDLFTTAQPSIRIEDVIFGALAILVVLHRSQLRGRSLRVSGIAAVVVSGLASTAAGVAVGGVGLTTAALYAIRPAEYWLIYPAILLLLGSDFRHRPYRMSFVLAGVTVAQTLAAVLQFAGLQFGFSKGASTRAAGLTAGPYELGAISAALLVYWLARRNYWLAVPAAAALLMSVSRISLLAAVAGIGTLLIGLLVRRIRHGPSESGKARRSARRAARRSAREARTGLEGSGRPVAVAVAALLLLVAGIALGPATYLTLLAPLALSLLVYWLSRRASWLGVPAATAVLMLYSSISVSAAVIGTAALVVVLVVRPARRRPRRHSSRVRRRPARQPLAGFGPIPLPPLSRRERVLVVGASALVLLGVGGAGATLVPALYERVLVPTAVRLATTSVSGSWDAAGELASRVPRVDTATQYSEVAYATILEDVGANEASGEGLEASNLIRFYRWHLILNNLDTPERIVLGLAPSFVGASVDGSYLRFLADGGVVGVLAWLYLIATWFRRVPLWVAAVVLSYLVGALFIDIVYAMRPMVLLWAFLAIGASSVVSMQPSRTALRRR